MDKYVLFEETYYVDVEKHSNFINRIRTKIGTLPRPPGYYSRIPNRKKGQPAGETPPWIEYRNDVLILPEFSQNLYYFDLTLKSEKEQRQLTVRFVLQNLYLIAYKNAMGRWCELDDGQTHILGSVPIGFKSNYSSIESALTDYPPLRRSREFICLSLWNLLEAIKVLPTTMNCHMKAYHILVLIQILSESIRFKNMVTHIGNLETFARGPDGAMRDLQSNWSNFSGIILKSLVNVDSKVPAVEVTDIAIPVAVLYREK